MEKGRISPMQLGILVFMFIISSATLLIPPLVTLYTKQDAWVVSIITMLVALPVVWLYISLGMRYPNLTLIEYTERILGKWFGKAVSSLFIFYFLIITAALLRQLGDMLVTLVLTDTPIQWVELLFFSLVVAAIRLGIEVSSRAAGIFFPWVLAFLFFLFVALLPRIEWKNLQPIFESPLNMMAKGVFIHMGIPFFDLVIFLMIFPYVSDLRKAKKVYFVAMIAGSIIIIVVTLMSTLVLGANLTGRSIYSAFELARSVNVGNFIQRIEVLVGGIWFITMFFKITVCFYASVLAIAQLFKLKHYKPLTFPLGMLVISLSMVMFSNTVDFREIARGLWTTSIMPYGLFFPIILLVVDSIKQKRAIKKGNPE